MSRLDDAIAAHPRAARLARHALRFIVVAGLSGAAELVASAVVHGQPIPDIRTIEGAALGPAILGTVRLLMEIDAALAAADSPEDQGRSSGPGNGLSLPDPPSSMNP